ncbi:MAG: hypothetical protein MI862_03230, partial [Desulfobacterales bacterium]|nr:hypothetical protein [Desulfobacterales bacterium]
SDGKPVITKDGEASSGTTRQVITGVYTVSAQTRSEGADRTPYFSHSQLSFRTTEAGPKGYVNPESTENPGGVTDTGDASHPTNPYLDRYIEPFVQAVTSSDAKVGDYFAAGLGEVHRYSLPV